MLDTPKPFSDRRFRFWQPSPESTVLSGAERYPVPLPDCPLPIPVQSWDGSDLPDDVAIGEGLYDYLRQYPDCEHNTRYAELLREAYPHYLADLAAQIVMIDAKTVDAPYVQRKISGLKILALLEPGNAALWQHLGSSCIELGLMFAELPNSRRHLLSAMGFLQRALELQPDNIAALNLLAQLDYWFGDYPMALRRWVRVSALIPQGCARETLTDRLGKLESGDTPDHPILDDLESVGETLTLIAAGDELSALRILERLDEDGTLLRELPMAEFYHLLGLCRERCSDLGGAFAAYEQALALDPECAPAAEGRDRILAAGGAR